MALRRVVAAILCVLLLAGSALAGDTYTLDRAHSSVNFTTRHMLVTTVPGQFTDFNVQAVHDPEDVTRSSVEVTIKAASIDTRHENRDNHLRSADFFEVEKYPEITFRSTRIEKRGEQLVAIGPLTIKDVTREIELPFTITGTVTDQRGNTRMGIEAETRVNRFDYNVAWNRMLEGGGAVVGNEIRISLFLQLVKQAPPAASNQD
jgi:polyisoprenoid-binding protein YceI